MAREPGEVGDAGVRDDQLRLRVRIDEPEQVVGDRRQAAPAVDEDRHPALRSEREHRRQPLVVEQELLGARMELDAAGAEVEAAGRLLDRLLVEREPDEGDHAAARALGERERAVVAGPEARMPVGLVEAEHEAARHAVPVHALLELLVAPAHAVDVGAEMGVRVEDLRSRRQLGAELRLEGVEQLLGPLERCAHPWNLPGGASRTRARGPARGRAAPARRRPTGARR